MRLTYLLVKNFRALTNLELEDIGESAVIAGPNGCGKSCVLDAIRLLKSSYGSYLQDEWQSWFGEFAINLNSSDSSFINLLQSKDRSLEIKARFRISPAEAIYLRSSAPTLLKERLERESALGIQRKRGNGSLALAANQRRSRASIDIAVSAELPAILTLLNSDVQEGCLTISPSGVAEAVENVLLELIFSTYEPQHLGVLDYHGPNRSYARENVANINLTIEASADKQKQHALYGYVNKYANLKNEMGASYVRHLLSKQANPSLLQDDSLTETLKELFNTFFPGKEFLGPKPTVEGKLLFPVRLSNGSEHDIDELSSGEKEVLYGYLKLHNNAPRHSMIMIDEPELHLNPRLMAGLSSFYHKHLGAPFGNQLFLVTHSDTLIRDAVGNPAYSVFHIQPPAAQVKNQASSVKAADDLERLVLELVGDLAAYRPGARLLIFESTEDAGFDARVTYTLFPELSESTNPISAGSKGRVDDLFRLLEVARAAGHLHLRFYSIVDGDNDAEPIPSPNRCRWGAYHIENYLLSETHILRVLRDIQPSADTPKNEADLSAALSEIASETIPSLVRHELQCRTWALMTSCISNGTDPGRRDVGKALAESGARSAEKLSELVQTAMNPESLSREESALTTQFRAAVEDGSWRERFRGRDILRRVAGKYARGMRYEHFRDLVLSRMRDDKYRPPGMADVIKHILSA